MQVRKRPAGNNLVREAGLGTSIGAKTSLPDPLGPHVPATSNVEIHGRDRAMSVPLEFKSNCSDAECVFLRRGQPHLSHAHLSKFEVGLSVAFVI